MKTRGKQINGMDVKHFFQLIEQIKEKPEIALFKLRASNHWIDSLHNQAVIDNFYGACHEFTLRKPKTFDMDEPPVLLGREQGLNPLQYLLVALSGCLTTSLVAHASAKGIKIKSVESRYEGDLDVRGFLGISELVPVDYEEIRVFFKIDADISDDKKEELVRMAQKYSPVYNTVSHPLSISVRLEK